MDVGGLPGETTAVQGAGDGRARRRDSLYLSARVSIAGVIGVHDARVRNLSAEGLMIELDHVVEPGTTVSLQIRGLGDLTGKVAWCTRGRIGIALDRPIDPRRARKPVGQGPSTPDYAKPLLGRG
ncbi:PilZ domain-containing protein [Sphingomonas bacterium]|uniref:PilZ domain-containing protein n=1 Tax=Sphingomonas bacterium TaxID=1895847 RepID=UPI001575927B|nr:PilZ domain-containing protein [Sphingomonas bacterium]